MRRGCSLWQPFFCYWGGAAGISGPDEGPRSGEQACCGGYCGRVAHLDEMAGYRRWVLPRLWMRTIWRKAERLRKTAKSKTCITTLGFNPIQKYLRPFTGCQSAGLRINSDGAHISARLTSGSDLAESESDPEQQFRAACALADTIEDRVGQRLARSWWQAHLEDASLEGLENASIPTGCHLLPAAVLLWKKARASNATRQDC